MQRRDNNVNQTSNSHTLHSRSPPPGSNLRDLLHQHISSGEYRIPKKRNADDPDFSEAFELLSYQLGKRKVPEPSIKVAKAPERSISTKRNKFNTTETKLLKKESLLDRFTPDKDFNSYYPGETDLIRVIRKSVEKYFIEYQIGSFRSYKELCERKHRLVRPYPAGSFSGYCTPTRGPWTSEYCLGIPEDTH